MNRRYTLPAVTTARQNTSIGIKVNSVSTLNKWVHDLSRRMIVQPFKFYWTEYPDVTEYYNLFGEFCPEYRQDGIRIVVNLYISSYHNPEYTLSEFCRMLSSGTRPSLGLCVTVTVQ
jgi:hypothetical protein